jgi:ADP-heptose:LPS heptosyltransferase
MAECGGVIGVDSGLGHLAVALDLPTVIIFSQPRVARAGPIGRAHQMAVGGDTAPEPPAVWAAWQSVALVERAGAPTAAIKVTALNDTTPLSPAQGTVSP